MTLEVPEPTYLGIPDLSPSCSSWSDNVYTTDSTTGSLSPYPVPLEIEKPKNSDMLNSQELELLSHYISHTSRVIPFDHDDLYALHVGIPNLAFGNKPLMASLLALSAACKCYDILKHSPEPFVRLGDMQDLLVLADAHHSTSLRQIQAAIYDPDQYDHLLATSALMVLYGSSSHCVRVSLAQKAKRHGMILADELLPSQSQWITLIRAAHTAYTGLLNGQSEDPSNVLGSPPLTVNTSTLAEINPGLSADSVYFPEDGPSEGTKRFLIPIVSATYGPALSTLTRRARLLHPSSPNSTGTDLQACFAALQVLADVYGAVFMGKEYAESCDAELAQLGRLHGVSPWLRTYLGRVTSATPSASPSTPLRRTIMAFLNRVPLQYLHLVQSTLDRIPVGVDPDNSTNWDDCMPLNPGHQLAIDIFAHWLILVMLLDGVWWIGGIGEWELGRVLSFVEVQGSSNSFTESGERWWPESMYNVKMELAEHINKTR